ncbi:Inositol-pentakisphosphate 2-kinase [Cladobotryum mycophilum]|uniref:Inositol-pentakisphosphate 2-kinase n=1 Tax=Cladobotryum mycophilum TaxID=491253 RepID=A0ABR0SEG2_9HYPO
MALHPLLPFPLLLNEDSASNQGSSVAGDCFDDDSSSFDPERHSPSNTGSLADDSEDEDYSWITPADMVILGDLRADPETPFSARDSRSSMYRQPQVSRLPKGTKPVRLVGEGAANAVFEIKVPRSSRISDHFKGSLLRVAKVPSMGQTPTYNYLLQQKFYHTAIKPILGEHAVRQELVVLHQSGIVDELNDILQNIDHKRKPKFRGTFIGQANWGFLVEDMRPGDGDDCELIEFKPKWLSQSPSAPENAIRCRQCALELRNFVQNPAAKKPCPENKPCPLALGNSDAPRQVNSPFRIAHQLADVGADHHFEDALAKIMDHDAIHVLRTQQRLLDEQGPLNASQSDPYFSLAMTLRDCTCFALIPADSDAPIKIRLGDFDWKNPKVKIGHWTGTEESLIEGGFYTADWILCDGTYYHPPTLCALEWTPDKRNGDPEILLIEDKNSADVEEVENLVLQLESKTRVYTHRTDLKALQKALGRFKKEPEGTSPDAVCNPLRGSPP